MIREEVVNQQGKARGVGLDWVKWHHIKGEWRFLEHQLHSLLQIPVIGWKRHTNNWCENAAKGDALKDDDGGHQWYATKAYLILEDDGNYRETLILPCLCSPGLLSIEIFSAL